MTGADLQGPVLDLLKKLVSCPSITPSSAGALELVEAELAAAGFELERIDSGEVCNLWATHGTGGPAVVLAGHVDVVPPGAADEWTSDPFTPTERDGRLYGRGTTDMKGGVAALLVAVADVVRRRPDHPGTLAVVITTDEEGPATEGVKLVVERLAERGCRFEHALVCEPSSTNVFGDTVRVGRRGSLTGAIEIEGVQGHVAYPDRCRNPVPELARIVAKLAEREFVPPEEGVEATTLQVVRLAADGGADNVVPGTARATVNFRFTTADDPADLKRWVQEVCDAESGQSTCSWKPVSPPYFTGAASRAARAVTAASEQVNGFAPSPSVGGGTSDGRFLVAVCDEVVEYGSTGLTMHMVDENIEIAELAPMTQVYIGAIERLLDGRS